jgi:ribonuclease HI
LLKRKGILDAVGAMPASSGAIIAFSMEGQPATVSGSLISLSAVAAALKAIIEQGAERNKIMMDDLYFIWLTRKLHNWKSKKCPLNNYCCMTIRSGAIQNRPNKRLQRRPRIEFLRVTLSAVRGPGDARR